MAKIIERMFKMEFKYKDEQLPTGSFPQKTPSAGLLSFCAKVFLRGEDDCDESQQESCGGVIPWKKTDWWRVFVMWLIHYAQYHEFFAEEGLPIDISGFLYRPLAAPWLAHVDHFVRLFEGTEDLELATLDEAEFAVCLPPQPASRAGGSTR